MAQQIPDKPHYKLGEVCEIADTQPYVLRFWESEFPQLKPRKSRTGHPIYTRDDVDLILRIKRLLHEQEFTLADAREQLDSGHATAPAVSPPATPDDVPAPIAATVDPGDVPALESELDVTRRRLGELRDRYDAAVDEIRRLKEDLEARSGLEQERDTARREADALRERLGELEKLEQRADRARGVQREHEQERKQLRERVDELAGTIEETAGERDRAVARAEEAEARLTELAADRERLAGLLEEAVALFRELHDDAAEG